jgi:arsenite-transporting ATPase
LALFSGKGGVGKTALACASALWLAHEFPHKRTLLISTDPADSLSSMLNVKVGAQPVAIRPGLSAMEVDANGEFINLKESYAGDLNEILESVNIDVTFDRVVLEKLIDLAPPGLDELMDLTRIVDLLAHDSYDTVVAAASSTGHLIRLLELPEMVDQWLKTFFDLLLKYERVFQMPRFADRLIQLSRGLKHFRALLKDPAQAALYAVAVPTQMAFEETGDLIRACTRMGIAVPAVFVNMLTPPSDCQFCTALRKRERAVIGQFRELSGCPQLVLVDRRIELDGLNGLETLGPRLFEQPLASLVSHG